MTHEERKDDIQREADHYFGGVTHYSIFTDCILRHLREVEAEAIKGLVTPDPNRQWVKCSDRMPTENDADYNNEVWWWCQHGRTVLNKWYQDRRLIEATHWMPTGLVRPEPPDSKP